MAIIIMMIAIYAVIFSSLIFVIAFIEKLLESVFFLYKTDKESLLLYCDNSKKAIVKKCVQLTRAKLKIKLYSKKFYAKFLHGREFSYLPVGTKFMVNDMYHKLCENSYYLKSFIDFDKLKNAGIFNEKPIFKMNIKNEEQVKKNITALQIVNKFIKFRAIFLLDKDSDDDNSLIKKEIEKSAGEIDYRIILLKDINLKLLQEVNKLDLNFKVQNEKVESDFSFEKFSLTKSKSNLNVEDFSFKSIDLQIKLTKFLSVSENNIESSRVCYNINCINNNSKSTKIKFSLNYKIKNEFFNIKVEKNHFTINYFNKGIDSEYFYFTNKLNKYEIIKNNGTIFIKFFFIINLNRFSNHLFSFVNSIENNIMEINKNEILKRVLSSNVRLERAFNLKIYIKNNDFNKFFNNKLIRLIIDEKLNENNLKKSDLDKKTVFMLSKLFGLDFNKLIKVDSFCNLYYLIIKEVFGISQKENIISINPDKNFYTQNFKIIVNYNGKFYSLYIDQNSKFKGLEVEGIIYSNLKAIDLGLIKDYAKLSI